MDFVDLLIFSSLISGMSKYQLRPQVFYENVIGFLVSLLGEAVY